jgi:hypothetical protein
MRLATVLVTTLALLQAACRTDSGTAPVNADFTLRDGQQLAVAESGMRIRLLGVPSDSRCAVDVVCVWSGNAVVELEVRAGNVTDTLALNTHVGAREGIVGEYLIRLVSLAPDPVSGTQPDPDAYRATLRVSRVGVACTLEARSALQVIVVDSVNPSTATFSNVRIVVQSASARDTAFVAQYDATTYTHGVGLAHERAGTYTVSVRADGYAPWTKSGIEVSRDQCHVITVPVTARLVR